MKWHYIVSIGFSIIVYAIICTTSSKDYCLFQNRKINQLTIPAYDEVGLYYKIADNISNELKQKGKVDSTIVTETNGSLENLEIVNTKEYSIGLCQLDVYENRRYEYNNVKIIDTLYNEFFHLVVNEDDNYPIISCINISNLSKLFQNFNAGSSKSGSKITTDIFIDFINEYCETEIDTSLFGKEYTNSALRDLADNEIECTAFVTGYPSGVIKTEIVKITDNNFKLLGIDTTLVDKFTSKRKEYTYSVIPSYGDEQKSLPSRPTPTFATPALLIANKDLPKEIAQASIDILKENQRQKFNKLFQNINFEKNNVSIFKNKFPDKSWLLLILISTFLLPILVSSFFVEYFKKVKSINQKSNEIERLKGLIGDKTNIIDSEKGIETNDYDRILIENKELKNTIIDLKTKLPSKLEIGMDDGKYFFRLEFPSIDIECFEYRNGSLEPIFKTLLSYAICKRLQKSHTLPTNPKDGGSGYSYTKYNQEFAKRMNTRLEENKINAKFHTKLPEILIKRKNNWELNIKRDNIKIAEKIEIKGQKELLEYLENRIVGNKIDFS